MKSGLIIFRETAKHIDALINNNCLFSCLIASFVSPCKMLFGQKKISLNEVMHYFHLFLKMYGKIILVAASLH